MSSSASETAPERAGRRLALAVAGILVGTALVRAARTADEGTVLFAFASPLFDSAISLGALLASAGRFSAWAALAAALACSGLWLAARPWQARGRGEIAQLLAALSLAAAAQHLLLRGSTAAGALLYAVALALQLVRRSDPPLPGRLPPALELSGIAALFALLSAVCVYRLDVYPSLLFDEEAYVVAARIWLGQVDPGTSIAGLPALDLYRIERFEVQPIPFGLQILATWLHPSGFLATRLAAVAAGAATLWICLRAVRSRLGAAATLCVGILVVVSPLFLYYSRTGLYVPFTILHGTACLAAVLRCIDRWDRQSAVLVGVLLGSSFYFYQLSWFTPLLAGAALATSPRLWTGVGLARAALIATSACIAILPALLLPQAGFEQLFEHSSARSSLPASLPDQQLGVVLLPEGAPPPDLPIAEDVEALPMWSRNGRTLLALAGDAQKIEERLASPAARDWKVLMLRRDWAANAKRMLERFFSEPDGTGDAMRLTTTTLIDPLLAPLLVLGIGEAVRRRREPFMRVVLAWAVLGALLPALFAGMAPRRVVLVLPVLPVLMTLPFSALLARRSAGARAALGLAAGLGLVAATCMGLYLFFERWDDPFGPDANPAASRHLELVEMLRALPSDAEVLVPTLDPRLPRHLKVVQRVQDSAAFPPIRVVKAPDTESVQRISCSRKPPFRWVTIDSPRHTSVFAELASAFEVAAYTRSGYRIYEVRAPLPGRCAGAQRSAPKPR